TLRSSSKMCGTTAAVRCPIATAWLSRLQPLAWPHRVPPGSSRGHPRQARLRKPSPRTHTACRGRSHAVHGRTSLCRRRDTRAQRRMTASTNALKIDALVAFDKMVEEVGRPNATVFFPDDHKAPRLIKIKTLSRL